MTDETTRREVTTTDAYNKEGDDYNRWQLQLQPTTTTTHDCNDKENNYDQDYNNEDEENDYEQRVVWMTKQRGGKAATTDVYNNEGMTTANNNYNPWQQWRGGQLRPGL
jgi:hypothetical protein